MNGFLPGIVLAAGLLLASQTSAAPSGCDGDLRDLNGVDYTDSEVAAAMMDSVPVAYSDIALRSMAEGSVELAVAVTAEGTPVCASVRQSAHPLLDREAVKAALASRYAAARRDGRTTFHWLRGVRIHGDLSVEVFDRVLAVVGERYEGNGRIEAVWMYTAERSEVPWGPGNFADIRVDVSTGEGMDTVRNHYFFNRRGDRFELTGSSLTMYWSRPYFPNSSARS